MDALPARCVTLELTKAANLLRDAGWLVVRSESLGGEPQAYVDDEHPDAWCLDGWFNPYPAIG